MENESYRVVFHLATDFCKLWTDGPWNFKKDTIALATWKQGISLEVIDFMEVEFWVHFKGVPWDHFTNVAAKVLAKRMEVFKMVDHGEQGFLWVRIAIDISKPLT